ncbi:MAG: PEP/pyruvate-binding domain-containing protein [Rhodocyclaceae bacterium]|nr:PEP/pyruvate-binding domain-containing protein [Rhodocyclaceae bacterium]
MSLLDIFSPRKIGSLLSAPEGEHRAKYQHFRTLLNHNHDALCLMAELEQLYFSGHPFDAATLQRNYARLFAHVLGLATTLDALSGGRFPTLPDVCRAIDAAIATALQPRAASRSGNLVLPLERVTPDMQGLAGAKAVNLAVMKSLLKLPVPDGFIITAEATTRFLEESDLLEQIRDKMARIPPEDMAALETGSTAIRQMVADAPVPPEVAAAIVASHAELEAKTRPGIRIAVRSSAVGEDSEATFAGQYATVLNVTRDGLLDAFKQVVASKYSPRAIAYRQQLGLEDADTPMCVIGLVMVDAQASGVMYTIDPATLDAAQVKISSLWGLGEQLVGGAAAADSFLVEKNTGEISDRQIAAKAALLIPLPGGGTRLEETSLAQQTHPSLADETLRQLCAGAVRIEEHYQASQDIEWAIDADNQLFFLQARPLHLAPKARELPTADLSGLENILPSGVAASFGVASGQVYIAKDEKQLSAIPDHAILVTRTASPNYAAVMGRINGLLTDVGSITSHLSSVAREFGVPAIVNTGNATKVLRDGELVTLAAEAPAAVYRGRVEQLDGRMRPTRKLIVDSPVHGKLRAMLDHISPLNLTHADAPSFSVDHCRSFHDVIRFCHEHAMREMFGISSAAEGALGNRAAVKITAHIPLAVYAIDLGGGLRDELKTGLKTRKTLPPDAIESLPMQAIWRGFTHPGINWAGTINFDAGSFMTIMASLATSELGPAPGGDSYALLSRDYMNFSAKFGYHFATIDALCGSEANHNYVSLQFAGGAGNYFGRSLRIRFLGAVLERLGFQVTLQGDLLEATFNRHDQAATQEGLDQLGRLLATSRLLDMTLSEQDAVDTLVEAFFDGEYDFLRPWNANQPEGFFTQLGHWQRRAVDDTTCLFQNGRFSQGAVSGTLTGLIGKTLGSAYHDFLDTIGAYYYFPLAIAKDGALGNGRIQVDVKPESGNIDRAGGVIFGLKNAANYFVFRINALEDNAILFEFVNGRRIERKTLDMLVATETWHRLSVTIDGPAIRCQAGDRHCLEYTAATAVAGHVGLWTKADSVTLFGPLTIEDADGVRTFGY